MARMLPLFINVDGEVVNTITTSESAAAAINRDSNGIGGCQIVGCFAALQSTSGKVTVRVYDDSDKTREKYTKEFDFTSVTQTSENLSAPIPFMDTPYWTAQGDSNANGKICALIFYVQAISVF